MARIRSHITFANVTSLMALFVALSGGAYAITITSQQIANGTITSADIKNGAIKAADMKANSVGSGQLKGEAVSGGDLADGSVGSGKIPDRAIKGNHIDNGAIKPDKIADKAIKGNHIDDGAIKPEKIANGSLTAEKFAPGQLPSGAPGEKGEQGAPGTGAATVSVVRQSVQIGPTASAGYPVMCPAGKKATGGGIGSADPNDNNGVIQSGPIDAAQSFATMDTGETPTGWYVRYFNASGSERTVLFYVVCVGP
jgi:hypothetical protein